MSRTAEIFKAALILLVIGTILRIFVVTPYRAPDSAMQGRLLPGDFLMTSQLSYKFDNPRVGDLILFEHPLSVGDNLVRRIVAREGQTVEIAGKKVLVDGQPLQESEFVKHADNRIFPREYSNRDYMPLLKVPAGQVFVLGDNRDQTEDSRNFGPGPVTNIKAKGLIVYFSWTPDPNEPKMKSPYIIPAVQIFFYSIYTFPSRVRWDRLFI
jgi:signal peptidase I